MKLIRVGEFGQEKPGVLLNDGDRVDASAIGSDYDEAFFGNSGLSELKSWLQKSGNSAPRLSTTARLGSPVCRPSKIICIGLNYRDHAAETKAEAPRNPCSFSKRRPLWLAPTMTW